MTAAEIDRLLDAAGAHGERRAKARRGLLVERDAGARPAVRPPRLKRKLVAFLLVHTAQYVLWLLSWWVIGRAVLSGSVDADTLVVWALLLTLLVPFRMLAEWLEGRIAIDGGALLKRRLLAGALRLRPDELRHQGAGQLLGRVLEAEAIETLAVTGGLLALVAGVEVVLAFGVLAAGAAPLAQPLLLGLWLAVTAALGRFHLRRQERWSDVRLELTHALVEHMVGHRTRLAQQAPERWHEGEDEALADYLDRSRALDRALTGLALVPRGWLLTALLALGAVLILAEPTTQALAVSLGGVLLGFRALSVLAAGLSGLAGALIAWRQVAPLVEAAGRPELDRPPVPATGALIDASGLHYHHPGRAEPTLRDCRLRIDAGERVLLEGASGSGKSTLAALIAGLRPPQEGSLRVAGTVVVAPQFHENHVFLAPLAFNLLLGRRWPPRPSDLELAAEVCRDLGLGPLLERMPAGLEQIVGETGWQLSHGERSLVFIARGLLAEPQLLVLDESLGALDPHTHRRALDRVLAQDAAVLLITH